MALYAGTDIVSNSSKNKKFINLPIIIYIKIAPPTLFPKFADFLPILLTYKPIITLLLLPIFLCFATIGSFIPLTKPMNPPTKNDATYDGPIVEANFS